MNLLVLNYSMNEASQVFSHQRRIVEKLSDNFDFIDVITAEQLYSASLPKVNIYSTSWKTGRHFTSALKFYLVAIPLLLKHRNGVLFSHMTEVQSCLIAPICKILNIRHFLWYAHKSNSKFLKFSYPFLSSVLTSTEGSCPIKGRKVITLGQSIDLNLARKISRLPAYPPMSWYHIGRMDPSKNLSLMIDTLAPFHTRFPDLTLHFYGSPTNKNAREYFDELKRKYAGRHNNWIKFHGQIPHSELDIVANSHDAFIHAFWGSLDKALIEAIILKRVVVSANPEYLKEFKNLRISQSELSSSLQGQLTQIFLVSEKEMRLEVEKNFQLASQNHGLDQWISRLTTVLKGYK